MDSTEKVKERSTIKKEPAQLPVLGYLLRLHAFFLVNRNPAFSRDEDAHCDNFAVVGQCEVMCDVFRDGD